MATQVLRQRLSCKLPIEVAWRGPQEMDHVTWTALQARYGPLRPLDLSAQQWPSHHRCVLRLTALAGCKGGSVLKVWLAAAPRCSQSTT